MQRNDRRVLVGTDAKLLDLLQRVVPSRYHALVARSAKRILAQRPAQAEVVAPAPDAGARGATHAALRAAARGCARGTRAARFPCTSKDCIGACRTP